MPRYTHSRRADDHKRRDDIPKKSKDNVNPRIVVLTVTPFVSHRGLQICAAHGVMVVPVAMAII